MVPSLSIVLPVHNAQGWLATQVARMLDVLPDFTPRFEVLVVDDGSTDHTEEVALELARQYPQLRIFRHPRPLGIAASVQEGLARTMGDIVFVQEDGSRFSPAEFRRLWALRNDRGLVLARATPQPRPLDRGLLARLASWGASLRAQSDAQGLGGLQMIRREAVAQWQGEEPSPRRLVLSHDGGAETARADEPHRQAALRPTGFLGHLRQFTLSE